ncbi:hypothetical protein Tco_0392651 [Tanacetum coccineum]
MRISSHETQSQTLSKYALQTIHEIHEHAVQDDRIVCDGHTGVKLQVYSSIVNFYLVVGSVIPANLQDNTSGKVSDNRTRSQFAFSGILVPTSIII